jgi:predicted DNA-binding transcriptional regulator YafY
VVKAVLERKRIKFRYHPSWSGRGSRTETANPWAIVIHNQWLYVVGHSTREAKPWLWRFARMDQVRSLRGRAFPPPTPAQFDPKTFFRGSFGIVRQPDVPISKVELALADHWAPYARSHSWHPTQVLGTRPDGRMRLTLDVRVCPELTAWVLSFGGDAEVIRPASLRRVVGAELNRAARNYSRAG